MENIVIAVIIRGGIAFRCSYIANKNGRNSGLAWLLGFLFGIWAVIGYAIAGKKSSVKVSTTSATHNVKASHSNKSHKTESSSYFDSLHHKE